jgi:hypothetical protein
MMVVDGSNPPFGFQLCQPPAVKEDGTFGQVQIAMIAGSYRGIAEIAIHNLANCATFISTGITRTTKVLSSGSPLHGNKLS